MAEYLIQDATLTGIADAIRNRTGYNGYNDGTYNNLIDTNDMAAKINNMVLGERGTRTGDYLVRVVDYDGTVLSMAYLNEGDRFTLPDAPEHDGLDFCEWSQPVANFGGYIIVENSDITIAPIYKTQSYQTEVDIVLTKATGLTFAFSDLIVGRDSYNFRILWGDGTIDIIDWVDGTIDGNLTHTYSDYGEYTIIIVGMSAIANGSTSQGFVLHNSKQSIVAVRFGGQGEILTIGDYAFYGCYNLTSVTIPPYTTDIGNCAFHNCLKLKSISLPYVYGFNRKIGEYAFYNCFSLIGVSISMSDTLEIGRHAFSKCYSLNCITIPEGVTNISDNTFYNCHNLTSITIPEGVTNIESNAFSNCHNVETVIIPGSVANIESNAFSNCQSVLTYDFTSHTSIPTLNNNAFLDMSSICQILVPANLYDEWVVATLWPQYADNIVAV